MKKQDVICLQSDFFKSNGFDLNHSQLFFEKVYPHGKQVVYVHFVEGSDESWVEYHLGIRINEVEELVRKYLPTPDQYANQSLTLVQTPHNLGKFYPRRIRITNDKQLSELLYSIENFFLMTGFNWLNQMINPIILEKEFLNHKEDPFEVYNMVESAFRSTALSKLYNPEDYPVLRQSFLERINSEEMTPFTIAAFLQFLNYLDNMKSVAA
ncbi:hypothetical protein SAMN04489724_1252 [Algoriphagus locisalis]|uniref:Uncharacterized protein n=1 Tax=Algoriphagus locisalis TaxID=305507 RepID=A0A1I6YVI9_9BACT|nr:hypothetical protein [Algoriphagus locisalis]SFT54472.1 hypothetical protein SAMN04489724_1252 [Algoriphagus locisalis]